MIVLDRDGAAGSWASASSDGAGGWTTVNDGHSHPYTVKADGTIEVGAEQGHAHEVERIAELAAGGEDAEKRLDEMAAEEAARSGDPLHKAYSRVLFTPEGQRLYGKLVG